jgi:hypothetical protein
MHLHTRICIHTCIHGTTAHSIVDSRVCLLHEHNTGYQSRLDYGFTYMHAYIHAYMALIHIHFLLLHEQKTGYESRLEYVFTYSHAYIHAYMALIHIPFLLLHEHNTGYESRLEYVFGRNMFRNAAAYVLRPADSIQDAVSK